MKIKSNRIMISACSSGSGKTTVTCGILKALKNRALKTVSCKCGPDYIDPMFHTAVLGIPSKNIDPFFANENLLKTLFARHVKGQDIAVVEGVMGYYDGLSFDSDRASSYEVAKTLQIPTILVINARGMALTMIAIIKGMMEFRKDSNIKGVILNNVSKMVYQSVAPVIEKELGIAALGYLPVCEDCSVESRHLGLVTPENIADINERLDKLGQLTQECIDIDRLLELAQSAPDIEYEPEEIGDQTYTKTNIQTKAKPRIAVARDEAFCFYYQDNMELLSELGCELIYFSPIKDKTLPENVDGLILGGGYPELYCDELSTNYTMLNDIRTKLENGLPCLAECGGYMYLHETMEDRNKKEYKMVGILKEKTYKCDRLVRFGYITLSPLQENELLYSGEEIKAHEFHYWDSSDNGALMKAEKPSGKRNWQCMHNIYNTFCGYPHLFYYSNVDFAKRFVELCSTNKIMRVDKCL